MRLLVSEKPKKRFLDVFGASNIVESCVFSINNFSVQGCSPCHPCSEPNGQIDTHFLIEQIKLPCLLQTNLLVFLPES